MTSKLRKLFVIAGPTAVGKTHLAVKIAERIGAEIISADSIQIYQGLDLLTAKPAAGLRDRVKHHLIGTIPPCDKINAARYAELANDILEEIWGRGKVALLVGGTGLYLHAIVQGLSQLPPKQEGIRHELEQLQKPALLRLFQALNVERSRYVDCNNERRMIRALETMISSSTDSFISWQHQLSALSKTHHQQFLGGILLDCDRNVLAKRIQGRIAEMFEAGVVEEFCAQNEINPGETLGNAIGFQQLASLVAGKIGLSDCKRLMHQATVDYAKRQRVWFRKYARFPVRNVSADSSFREAEHEIVRTIIERAKNFNE